MSTQDMSADSAISIALRVWTTRDILQLILEHFFISLKFTVHHPDKCPTRGRGRRAGGNHISIFLVNRFAIHFAHPIFLANSTFSPAWCVYTDKPSYLPAYFGALPSRFLCAVRRFEVQDDNALDLIGYLKKVHQGRTRVVVRVNKRAGRRTDFGRKDVQTLRRAALGRMSVDFKFTFWMAAREPNTSEDVTTTDIDHEVDQTCSGPTGSFINIILRADIDGSLLIFASDQDSFEVAREKVLAFFPTAEVASNQILWKLLTDLGGLEAQF